VTAVTAFQGGDVGAGGVGDKAGVSNTSPRRYRTG
jgi:hypothetical protein